MFCKKHEINLHWTGWNFFFKFDIQREGEIETAYIVLYIYNLS